MALLCFGYLVSNGGRKVVASSVHAARCSSFAAVVFCVVVFRWAIRNLGHARHRRVVAMFEFLGECLVLALNASNTSNVCRFFSFAYVHVRGTLRFAC